MKPAAKLLRQVRRGVQNIAYNNPLYQKILASGEVPNNLTFTPPDLWPGSSRAGLALISAEQSMFDGDKVDGCNLATALRNLRAVGSDAARQRALKLIASMMHQTENWDEVLWKPAILGERLSALVGFHEFYAEGADIAFLSALTEGMHKQWKHLLRTLPASLTGLEAMHAALGLMAGGFNFPEGDKALSLGCDFIRRLLISEILPDGAHRSRNPSVQLHMLRHLLMLRSMLHVADIPLPDDIALVIAAMAPVLKFYRHADGGLALFHGGVEETALMIDAALNDAAVKSRMPRRLPQGGYERVTAGRSLMMVDCAMPPATGHAGFAAFEFAQGKERIVVNCGHPDPLMVRDASTHQRWAEAMAATAAHSTLVVGDANAADVSADGTLRATGGVTAMRYEQDGIAGVEVAHTAYQARFGITHRRVLELDETGDVLKGRDEIEGGGGKQFVIRWHLHPGIIASLSHGGQGILLRTEGGAGWRFRAEDGVPELEPSVYCGDGQPRRTLQIRLAGTAEARCTVVQWSLVREKKT